MNRILVTTIIAATVGTVSGQSIERYKDMAPYVYPQNAPATAPAAAYLPDGETYLQLSDDGKRVVKHETKTGAEIETIFDTSRTRENNIESIEGFTLSPDGSKLLVYTGKTMIYRRSFRASYYTYDTHSRILRPLSENFKKQRAPLFSPDGRMVAFVGDDNNIHLKKIDFDTEVAVTRDGAVNSIINGVPDWTYEEEFATDCSMTWAPDNMTLCYIKYNETAVPTYSFPLYDGTCEPKAEYALYPGSFTYKYPVAGQPNSTVSVHSYDVDNRKTKDITLPGAAPEYIPRLQYAFSPDRVIVTTLNRSQNRMELFALNPRSGVAKSLLVEETKAWISPATYENIKLYPDNFVILSSRSGFSHAYSYTYAGALDRRITSGDYDVTDYYGCDSKGNHYVQSTVSGSVNRVVSRIDIKGNMKNLSPDNGTASAVFNPTATYYTLNYSNAATAPVYTLYSAPSDKKVRVIEDNAAYAARYSGAPVKEFVTMPGDNGVTLNAYIIKPADFNASRKYPVIIYQYSGPGSQEVLDRWRMEWTHYYATQGYVVVGVDPRGTGGRGREFETIVYKNLGHYETLDLQAATRHIASLPYVDSDRIGITGWSYGGYETLMAVSTGRPQFAAAVAIAPVTDWRYYDTVYAERYMLTPAENEEGYETSAPLSHAAAMNCPLLIMHGTADDNVHLFNTMQYVSVLESNYRVCDMMLFPNMNHSINYCDARLVVYAKALDYFNLHLNK